MIYILIFMLSVLFIGCRVVYMNLLFDDWNHWLSIYIEDFKAKDPSNEQHINYLETAYLKTSRNWWKIARWQIKDFINNEFLIDSVTFNPVNRVKREK